MQYFKNLIGIYLLIIISFFSVNRTLAGTNLYYNVMDYGAQANGQILDTKSIQNAVDDCNKSGGGIVIFPAGTYLSGTIIMKNNVILNLQAGSKILGSKNIDDYPMYSLIWAENCNNIGIGGFGILDGQGKSFQGKKARSSLIKFVNCTNVRVENVTLQHPAAWTQHYLKCDGVTLRDLKIFAHGAENNDMVDINQSKNVIISGLIGDSDDDGITLKSIGDGLVENVVISDCIIRTRTNGIKAGTESYAGFRDITITNCFIGPSLTTDGFSGRDEGLAGIALESVDGGVVENVTISNLVIEEMTAPIFIRLGNRSRKYPDLERRSVGSINNVKISNVIANNASKTGCSIVGEIGHPIKNISITNVRINYLGGGTLEEGLAVKPELVNEYPECIRLGILPAYGFFVRHAEGLTFRDVELTYDSDEHRPAMIFNDVKNLRLFNFNAQLADDALGQLVLQNTHDVFITDCSPQSANVFLRLEQNCQNISAIGNNFSKVNKPVFIDQTINTDALNIAPNLTGKSDLFDILQPNIERDSLGMVTIYYPNNADVYYALDGAAPTKSSEKYVQPFSHIDPVVIKAKAFVDSKTSSTARVELKRLAVLTPHIFPSDQFFNEKIKVRLRSNTKEAEIYYSLDGSIPDKSSLKYTEPIIVKKKAILSAIACKDGYMSSKISTSKFEPIEKTGGVQSRYYEGRWEKLPNFLYLTPKRSGIVDRFQIAGLKHRDLYFGFVLQGYLSIETDGEYTFYVSSNDGSMLLIDNTEIINNDGAHATIEKSGQINLNKGKHLIELRYFQAGGGIDLNVYWSGPGFEKRELMAEDLSEN